jgi:hypothetical protein
MKPLPFGPRVLAFGILTLISAFACSQAPGIPQPGCQRNGVTSKPPTSSELAALAGQYEVSLVNSQSESGDSLIHGRLVLWVNDSSRRHMPPTVGNRPGDRPLAGEFASYSTTVPSVPNQYEPGSEDHPAVEMVGATIHLGGLEFSDAGGTELRVKEIVSTGFRGEWIHSTGFSVAVNSATGRVVPEPKGYFCARRVPPA